MITGHLGVAGAVLGATRTRLSVTVFIALAAASFTPDLVDAMYVVLGICSPYGLYSHTIPAVAFESAVVGAVAYLATGSRSITASFVVVVLLHIAADYFTGRKLLLPGGEMVGLQWYERPLHDFLLEGFLVVVGWWMLRRTARPPRWAGSLWLLLLTLGVQAALDLTVVGSGHSLKPTACFNSPAEPMSSAAKRGTEYHVVVSDLRSDSPIEAHDAQASRHRPPRGL